MVALSGQLVALLVATRPNQQNPKQYPKEEVSEDDFTTNPFVGLLPTAGVREVMVDNCNSCNWNSNIKIEIPEFHGGLTPEEFVGKVAIVEETLELKEVLGAKQLPLLATRFRDRVAAWWQQNKLTISKQGKETISSREKLKKHMRTMSVPHNYTRKLYQRLQNLQQGTRSVEE